MIFKDKISDFIVRHLFIALVIFRIYVIYRKTQNLKKKKRSYRDKKKPALKNGVNK